MFACAFACLIVCVFACRYVCSCFVCTLHCVFCVWEKLLVAGGCEYDCFGDKFVKFGCSFNCVNI